MSKKYIHNLIIIIYNIPTMAGITISISIIIIINKNNSNNNNTYVVCVPVYNIMRVCAHIIIIMSKRLFRFSDVHTCQVANIPNNSLFVCTFFKRKPAIGAHT